MFKNIYFHELTYWFKNPAIYGYGIAFFGLAFLLLVGTGGLFDPPPISDKMVRLVNSPFEINYVMNYFNKFFLFLLPAIVGASIYKDYKYRMHSILYTFPIDKSSYLLGKFLAAISIVLLLTLCVGLAMGIGSMLPGLHENKIGPFRLLGYLQAYGLYVFPNMIIFGAITFAIVTWTRNIYAGFVGILILFLLQVMIEKGLGGMGEGYYLALLDPFGEYLVLFLTKNWTLKEQNNLLLPVSTLVIGNRLIWLTIAGLIFGLSYRCFSFSERIESIFQRKKEIQKASNPKKVHRAKVALQTKRQDFSLKQKWSTVWTLSLVDFKFIFKSKLFLVLAFAALLAAILMLARVSNLDDMALLPATRIMLFFPTIFFTIILTLITFLYAGMLVHRPTLARMNQLIDISPNPDWVFLFSKVLALAKMQVILLSILMMAGIFIQLFNGYDHFEIPLYLFHLYALVFPTLLIWGFASVFIQTLFSNTYVGLFILILAWIGLSGLPQVGIDSMVLLFNKVPELSYSDLNGYAQELGAYFLVQSYWLVFGFILLILSLLFWNRGVPETFGKRLRLAKQRFKGAIFYSFAALVIVFLVLGIQIYQEEQKAQRGAFLEKNQGRLMKNFRANYEAFTNFPQPKITKVKINLDLYPERHAFYAQGDYVLLNKTEKPIDTLLLRTGFDELTRYKFGQPTELLSQDTFMKFSLLKLKNPLLPGDTLSLNFVVENTQNERFERNSDVLGNGTFIRKNHFPRIGYSYDDQTTIPVDSAFYEYHSYGVDADLIEYEAVVSTAEDQVAITPGTLQKTWTRGNRRYFHYKVAEPMEFSFCFNSGRFEKSIEHWQDIQLEIFHHPNHDHNLDKMMNGLKKAFTYNTKYFSPYQFKEIRIVEFPQSEGTYATTSGNSIPMSEIRFLVNADTSTQKIDLSFYVPAHELTHQWWGGQVLPARTLGAVMLTESITEYITLQIYKNHYGLQQAHNFLAHQRGRYLRGRTKEEGVEPPLVQVAFEQAYISYGKGTIAFNALCHHWGEDQLNAVLKEFLEDYQSKGAPYPSSMHLVKRLKRAMPDSLQYLIEDMFEKVTFYENEITKVQGVEKANQSYELAIDFSMRKYRAGAESDVLDLPLADFVELGIYNDQDDLLALEKVKVTSSATSLNVLLDQRAVRVELDPNLLLIDKDREKGMAVVDW